MNKSWCSVTSYSYFGYWRMKKVFFVLAICSHSSWYSHMSSLVDVCERLHTFTYDTWYSFPFFPLFVFFLVFLWPHYFSFSLSFSLPSLSLSLSLPLPPSPVLMRIYHHHHACTLTSSSSSSSFLHLLLLLQLLSSHLQVTNADLWTESEALLRFFHNLPIAIIYWIGPTRRAPTTGWVSNPPLPLPPPL